MHELWSMSFQEWKVPERISLLDQLGIPYELMPYGDKVDIYKIQGLSSGQEEVWKFVTDPVRKIDFSILDLSFGRALLKLHYEFWSWKFRSRHEDTE